jgi:hypothetical protein
MQASFPSGSTEGLRDDNTVLKNEFGKSKTCITKCSTGGMMSTVDEDDLELKESKGWGQSVGIMVKTETVVHEETGLRN